MEKVVCVTGASGFIASWLVKLLLDRGYTVKATVRNPRQSSLSLSIYPIFSQFFIIAYELRCKINKIAGNSTKVAHLTSLQGANQRLHLYEADLLEEGSFDSAVDGCQTVFHTASPVALSVSDPQVFSSLIQFPLS